jgi:hypothetical protein
MVWIALVYGSAVDDKASGGLDADEPRSGFSREEHLVRWSDQLHMARARVEVLELRTENNSDGAIIESLGILPILWLALMWLGGRPGASVELRFGPATW